jgi:hypothetical protein
VGPKCPLCGAIYEWTEAEVIEDVMSPKVYFCPVAECRHMWVLAPDEIKEIQQACGGMLDRPTPRWDDGLYDDKPQEDSK